MSSYTLTESISDGYQICYNITINSADAILQAHFPEHPIMPGACLVQMVQDAISTHLKRKIEITCLSGVKFLRPVTPELSNNELSSDGLMLLANITEDKKVSSLIATKKEKYAKIAFTYKFR